MGWWTVRPCAHTPHCQADVAQLLGTSLLPRSCCAADADAAANAHFKEAVLPAMRAAGEVWLPAALHERGAFEVPLVSRAVMMRCVLRMRRVRYETLISHFVIQCRCRSPGSSHARSSAASRTSTAPPASGRTSVPTRPPPSRATPTAWFCCRSTT